MRTLSEALAHADKLRGEIPQLIQPEASAYDIVVLADEVRRLGSMPRRWCSVHNREEFKYESLEHELNAADKAEVVERRVNPDERYRYGWCCDHDFETGQYRTGDCIGPTRNADAVERLTAAKVKAATVIEEAGKVGQLMNLADADGYQRGVAACIEKVKEVRDTLHRGLMDTYHRDDDASARISEIKATLATDFITALESLFCSEGEKVDGHN